MEVQLISKETPKVDESSPSKISSKRPPSIQVSKQNIPSHRWKECKIIGKNISIRSYGAACAFQNKFYLYGGYQILKGSLSDFYSISLADSEQTFNWTEIIPKSKENPGSRQKHALVGTSTNIYLIGGLLINNTASNDIYKFDPSIQTWTLVRPDGVHLPPLQSFCASTVNVGGEEKIIIAFGFNEDTASPSNTVYEYNPANNKLRILFEGSEKASENTPLPRMGCAMASDDSNVYFFGGKNDNERLNDLWAFSLSDYKFKRLPDDGELPAVRNGHTMTYHDNKLYVFGGIHDITWELDDLHIYNLKTSKWTTLEQDSPRKLEKKANEKQAEKPKEKVSPKKKGFYQTLGTINNRASSPISANKMNFSSTLMENKGDESPGKMLDQQRRKVFFQKKAQMLKNFQVSSQDRDKYLSLETSSQAMKISLDVIGNPDPKAKVASDRLTDFGKQSESKFLGPLNNSNNIILGKKPCARDGHCAVLINNQLIICAGDRHQMSFNDIYKLDLSRACKDLQEK